MTVASLVGSLRFEPSPGQALFDAGVEKGSLPTEPGIFRLSGRSTGELLGWLVDCGTDARACWEFCEDLKVARSVREAYAAAETEPPRFRFDDVDGDGSLSASVVEKDNGAGVARVSVYDGDCTAVDLTREAALALAEYLTRIAPRLSPAKPSEG